MPVQLTRRIREFTDISLSFQANPVTGDITTLKNERAIQNAMKNCVMIATKEKVFNSQFGSAIGNNLFELDDEFSTSEIGREVRRTIEYNEPRVKVNDVRVKNSRDNQSASSVTKNRSINNVFYDNAVFVTVIYEIIGYQEIFNTEFILTPSSAF